MLERPFFRDLTRPADAGISARSKGGYPAGVYVSSVVANGIPVGNDTTGDGTPQKPYLTIDKGYIAAAAGQTIWLNGDPASPTDYRHGTYLNIQKALRLDAVRSYGAVISSTTTTTRAIHFLSSSGMKASLGRVIVDGRDICPYAVTIGDGTIKYSVTFDGTKFTGFTTHAVNSTGTATRADIVYNGVVIRGGNVSGGLRHLGMIEGSVYVRGADIVLTSQKSSDDALVQVRATVLGVACEISGVLAAATLDPSLTGVAVHYGVWLTNIKNARIENCDITFSGAPGGRVAILGNITALASAGALDSSGGIIRSNIGRNYTNGGHGFSIGADSQNANITGKVGGGLIERNEIYGDAHSNAGLHGILTGSGANTIVRYNKIKDVGLGIVDKEGDGARIYCNLIIDCMSSYLRIKGAKNGIWSHNTVRATGAYNGVMVYASENDATLVQSSGNVVSGNLFADDGVSLLWINVLAGQGVAVDHNDWFGLNGQANPFRYQGSNYANLTAWQAVEATAVSIDPAFVAPGSDNLRPTNVAIRIVPADPLVPSDFAGAGLANPAAAGAYEIAA